MVMTIANSFPLYLREKQRSFHVIIVLIFFTCLVQGLNRKKMRLKIFCENTKHSKNLNFK